MKHPSPLRRMLAVFLLFYLLILAIPTAVYFSPLAARSSSGPASTPPPGSTPQPSSEPAATPEPPPDFLSGQSLPSAAPTPLQEEASFTLQDASTGEVFSVPEREFLASAIACEMDLASPEEALKAQAVAAYTFYCRQRETGAPIACNQESWLVYAPESAMQARWGEDYAQYKALLDGIVDQVFGQTLTYQGELALTSYFAISPGGTEAVENVWSPDAGAEHPYLQAVASPGDQFSDGYLSTVRFSKEEFQAAAADAFDAPAPDLTGPVEDWLTELEYTPSGTVKTATLGGVTVTGQELRSALGLRSAAFTLEVQEDGLVFQVKGWGHGVGMSQAGAVFLAKRGADYREILAHYYPGTQLTGGE